MLHFLSSLGWVSHTVSKRSLVFLRRIQIVQLEHKTKRIQLVLAASSLPAFFIHHARNKNPDRTNTRVATAEEEERSREITATSPAKDKIDHDR